jgi:hypothetical protein
MTDTRIRTLARRTGDLVADWIEAALLPEVESPARMPLLVDFAEVERQHKAAAESQAAGFEAARKANETRGPERPRDEPTPARAEAREAPDALPEPRGSRTPPAPTSTPEAPADLSGPFPEEAIALAVEEVTADRPRGLFPCACGFTARTSQALGKHRATCSGKPWGVCIDCGRKEGDPGRRGRPGETVKVRMPGPRCASCYAEPAKRQATAPVAGDPHGPPPTRREQIDAECEGFLEPGWKKADGNPWRKRDFYPEVVGAERERLSNAMDNALFVLGTVPQPVPIRVLDANGNVMATYKPGQRKLAENFAAKFPPKRGARVVVA